ncbi:MAG: hypothetical protein GX856_09525 [Gammaproteobacteria bacterium]|jgi:hypothetical protein|nr:hypothetical protein [Gammaproteobacteria bacterium]
MAFPPARTRSRTWRRLALAALVLLLLVAYGTALRALERRAGDDVQPVVRPPPTLDRHTPRVG